MTIALILAGPLVWSLTEYGLHAWAGHRARGRNPFSREHLRHHGQKNYFSPVRNKLSAAVPAIGLLALGGYLVLGLSGLAFALSFAGSYAGYEYLHWRLHHFAPRGPIGRLLRRHHFYHHFHDPDRNHGVTSPLWDWVFATKTPVREPIRVPARLSLDWLMEDGQIKAEFAVDYQIRGSLK